MKGLASKWYGSVMSLAYTFKESLAGYKRNRSATVITILTVSISLLLLGIFAIITINFSGIVSEIRNRVELEVFLKEGLTDAQLQQVKRALLNIPGIEDVRYISKEEAAKIFEDEIGENFYDILDDNPLPASYRVAMLPDYSNTDSIKVITARIEKFRAVEGPAVYRKQFLELIDKRARAFWYATLFVGIILAISAIILVANTIRLTIYAKRELIRTMKLVGATSTFIRLPFLFEGMLHGVIGGVIASILIEIGFSFFIQPISEDLLMNMDISVTYFFLLILLGCFLGFIGSIVSIGRFLKEALVSQS